MRVLIAEDEIDIALSYKKALEQKNHEVVITPDGEECLKKYRQDVEEMSKAAANNNKNNNKSSQSYSRSTFDAVVLDYKMPKKDGIEAAKEILEMNSKQRIIFASAYVKDTLEDAVKELKRVVELIQKPFEANTLVDTVEDKEVYENLKDLMVSVRQIRGDQPTQKQIKDLFESLRKIQKGRTF
jgi:CheY-like chemotaxis protein